MATTYEYIYTTLTTALATIDATVLPVIENDDAAFSGSKPNMVLMVGDEVWENQFSESGKTTSPTPPFATVSFSIEIYAKCAVKQDGTTVRAKIGELGDKIRAAFWTMALATSYNTSTVGATNISTRIISAYITKIYNAPMIKENRLQALVTGAVRLHIKQ